MPTAYNGLVEWEIDRDATESNETPLILSPLFNYRCRKKATMANQYEMMRLSVSYAAIDVVVVPRIKLLVWSGCATLSRRIR